jgi:hypothetical protein
MRDEHARRTCATNMRDEHARRMRDEYATNAQTQVCNYRGN